MRKYFLLSAVALLTATTANATTDYAEVTARATIEVAGTLDCTDLDFGTIVVKQNNKDTYVDVDPFSTGITFGTDIIKVTGSGMSYCTSDNDYLDVLTTNEISLVSEETDDVLTVQITNHDQTELSGYLSIPANVKAGEYTGSFTVTQTY